MPVETPKASFTAGMAGMNRWIDSGPMKVMETSAMKKYQRGRKGIVMLGVSTRSHLEVLRELSAIQLRTNVLLLNLSYYEVQNLSEVARITGEQCATGKHRGGCDDAVGHFDSIPPSHEGSESSDV